MKKKHWKTKLKEKNELKRELAKLIIKKSLTDQFKIAYQSEWYTNKEHKQKQQEINDLLEK